MNTPREENLEATIRMLREKLQDMEDRLAAQLKTPERKVRKKDVKFNDSKKDAKPGPTVEKKG